jgi:hypothetical protein
MGMIKKFLMFINEDLKSDIVGKIKDDGKEIKEIKEFLIGKIIETKKAKDEKEIVDFIDGYLQDSEKNKIEGLTEKSDMMSFWEKNNGMIDEILSKKGYFKESPSKKSISSTYDYIIKSTEDAIKEILMAIKTEIESPNPES